MAYPATDLSELTAGTLVDDTDWNDLVDGINFLAKRPACHLFHSTTNSVANTSQTALAFNSERYDTDSMHSTSSNTSRITFNTAGLYIVSGAIEWTSNAASTGLKQIGIRLNGSTFLAVQLAATIASTGHPMTVTVPPYKFAVNDYVELVAFQTTGSSQTINSSSNYSPEFAAVWVGRG